VPVRFPTVRCPAVAAALASAYAAVGLGADQKIVPYGQHGYCSANTWLALTLLGYPHVRDCLGSWDEWGNHADLPLATTARLH
jgi:thiosulfate/3-mercaptopyruvate sulfurtransferase